MGAETNEGVGVEWGCGKSSPFSPEKELEKKYAVVQLELLLYVCIPDRYFCSPSPTPATADEEGRQTSPRLVGIDYCLPVTGDQ